MWILQRRLGHLQQGDCSRTISVAAGREQALIRAVAYAQKWILSAHESGN